MSGTTSLSALPSENSNVNMQIREKTNEPTSALNTQPGNIIEAKLDSNTINEIVSGIQKAKVSFDLPTRDIPGDTERIQKDPEVRPNYIPENNTRNNYIKEEEDIQSYVHNQMKKDYREEKLNEFYDEIQMPIVVSLLFFCFQLPAFKKFLNKNIPFVITSDGNLNLNGYIFYSILFGASYHFISKIIINA